MWRSLYRRISVIDQVGVLTVHLLTWPRSVSLVDPTGTGGGKGEDLDIVRLDGFERKDVWHMKWAQVNIFCFLVIFYNNYTLISTFATIHFTEIYFI